MRSDPASVKIVISGGFGVGKTTLIGSISEIPPVHTEEVMTEASEGVDPAPVEGKTTTTVAFDFGRLTLDENFQLFLFGTPGQGRFWFMWDDVCRGALGALVLADVNRITDAFPVIDYFERETDMPFAVAVNWWNGEETHELDEIRQALALPNRVPLFPVDARDKYSVNIALQELMEYAIRSVS
ncbi:ATP-binding protein [Kibdelosporangium aridum]|uniref:ATP-binding protein n=1 Tax=Kibdelosporangium aridum TaxID=2030 RepID=A0A428Z583_KIBAR|nr:ATP/GTP-binding protein [Kibdelosporangium aridum]RSM81938.1 ATP-binding protein [Kibdelosporangium aridum]